MIFKIAFSAFFISSPVFAKDPGALWKTLPVQHKGRIKPFDTMARETLIRIYGRDSYKGRSAVNVILSWTLIPDHWDDIPFILTEGGGLKKTLQLNVRKRRFAPKDFQFNKSLANELIELQSLQQRGIELQGKWKNLNALSHRLALYEAVKTGALLKVYPGPDGAPAWRSLRELQGENLQLFGKALSAYARLLAREAGGKARPLEDPPPPSFSDKRVEAGGGVSAGGAAAAPAGGALPPPALKDLKTSLKTEMSAQVLEKNLQSALKDFQAAAFKDNPSILKGKWKISLEVFYNKARLFHYAWILYLSFLLIYAVWAGMGKTPSLYILSPLYMGGFALHTLGLGIRALIMARPPVSNMYETTLWVPWAAFCAGLVFLRKKTAAPFIAAVILAFFGLFTAEISGSVLDPSLQPLEAVLRSNFWLSTHVLIITMSYAFFALAFVLGDIALLSFLFSGNRRFFQDFNHPIYRMFQWGLASLTLGTVLGALWADYSWGRFWGWDPKESWALITLLGYAAALHGRLAGWIRPMGLCLTAVLLFFLVLMAWYGVNFILGKGLHSYGFGSGGVEYVAGFFALHILLCIAAALRSGRIKVRLPRRNKSS